MTRYYGNVVKTYSGKANAYRAFIDISTDFSSPEQASAMITAVGVETAAACEKSTYREVWYGDLRAPDFNINGEFVISELEVSHAAKAKGVVLAEVGPSSRPPRGCWEGGRAHSAITITANFAASVCEEWKEYHASPDSKVTVKVTIPARPSYTVAYNANGGSGAPGAQTKWHGENLTLQSGRPTRAGHYFKGWATSPSGAAAYQPGATYTGNAALALYAVWEPYWAVSYNDNGVPCTGMPSSQVKNMNVALALSAAVPAVADRSRTFLGWATEPKGPVAYEPGATYTGNAPLNLYAVWRLEWAASFGKLAVERCGGDGAPDGMGCRARVAGTVEVSGAMELTARAVLMRPDGDGWAEVAVADIDGGEAVKPASQGSDRISWTWLSGEDFPPDLQASFKTGVRLYEGVQSIGISVATGIPTGRDTLAAGESHEFSFGHGNVTSVSVFRQFEGGVSRPERDAEVAWAPSEGGTAITLTAPADLAEGEEAWCGEVSVEYRTYSTDYTLLADIAGPSVTMTRGTPVIDIHSSGRGIGFGTTAPEKGFRWSDLFPPGFIYLSALPTSPAEMFGGVWIEIKNEGFLRLAGNFLAGGSNSKTIAAANMPAHTHGIPAHGHTGNSVNTGNVSAGHYHYAAYNSAYGAARSAGGVKGDGTGADIYNGALAGSGFKVFRQKDSTGLGYQRDTSGVTANHTHSVTTSVQNCAWFRSESAGSGTALDVTPKYQNVYAWRRATPEEEAALAAG